ncbi:MAG: nucleotidyltransferase family protein [Pyrinomonadaceae bacterium]
MKTQPQIGLILLAAGESRRMGSPKQILRFEGETLLRRAARAAVESDCRPVIVVLGAGAEILRNELERLPVEIAVNRDWPDGMGGSIRAGLERLLEIDVEVEAAIITVCDQPAVSAGVIGRLIEKYLKTGALIVASAYARTLGVPALFDRRIFSELKELPPGSGAKMLIERYSAEVVSVPFPEGAIDIDTPEDYRRMRDQSRER